MPIGQMSDFSSKRRSGTLKSYAEFIVWHGLAVCFVLLFPTWWYETPLWRLLDGKQSIYLAFLILTSPAILVSAITFNQSRKLRLGYILRKRSIFAQRPRFVSNFNPRSLGPGRGSPGPSGIWVSPNKRFDGRVKPVHSLGRWRIRIV